MTDRQRDLYQELVAKGEPIAGYPNPYVSQVLSILPGGGQFYNGQIGLGIVNFLFWPWSILWGAPSAYIDAGTIRKIRSVDAYLKKQAASGRREDE